MRRIPPVVKNLIIINALMYLITWIMESRFNIDLTQMLGYHYVESKAFQPYQLITYMFMHGGFFHILLNMYALFIFGMMLEHEWGGKKFFMYYIFCGLGAIVFQTVVFYIQYHHLANEFHAMLGSLTPDTFQDFVKDHFPNLNFSADGRLYAMLQSASSSADFKANAEAIFDYLLQVQMSIPTVGASGAVFGILLAFGMLFPNLQLMLLFPPIPIKAKWLVIIYGAFELYSAISQPGDTVAHFAHLGGMLFGFILIKLWAKRKPMNHF